MKFATKCKLRAFSLTSLKKKGMGVKNGMKTNS
jgi:hypothetical protein